MPGAAGRGKKEDVASHGWKGQYELYFTFQLFYKRSQNQRLAFRNSVAFMDIYLSRQ